MSITEINALFRAGNAAFREQARRYVGAHPEEFRDLEALTLEQIVTFVDDMRTAGNGDEIERAEVWQWATYPAQQITGNARIG